MEDETHAPSGNNRRWKKKKASQWLLFVGDCRDLGDALASKPKNVLWLSISFVDSLLRGYGQVTYADNPLTGLLYLTAITIENPFVSLVGLICGAVGILTAVMMQQPESLIRAGLHTYNPLLIGVVTATLLPVVYGVEMNTRFWLFTIVGAVVCVYLTSAMFSLMSSIGRYPMPCFTVPFVVVQVMLFLCVVSPSSHISSSNTTDTTAIKVRLRRSADLTAPLPDVLHDILNNDRIRRSIENTSTFPDVLDGFQSNDSISLLGGGNMGPVGMSLGTVLSQSDPEHVDWGQVFTGIILSISELFVSTKPVTAVVMYLGLILYSPTTCLMVLLGSTISTLIGLAFSSPPYDAVYQGIWGFNGLLVCAGLGGFCFVLTLQCVAVSVVATVFCAVLQNVLNPLFETVPLPILTVPFNISILIFLCATTASESGLVRPAVYSFPERQRVEWSRSQKENKEPSEEASLADQQEKKEAV